MVTKTNIRVVGSWAAAVKPASPDFAAPSYGYVYDPATSTWVKQVGTITGEMAISNYVYDPATSTWVKQVGSTTGSLPISKAVIFNTVVLAATDFLALDLSPTNTPTLFTVYVCLSVGGILSVQRIRGGVTVVEELNGATGALTANKAYAFDVFVNTGDTINFQTSVGATIIYFTVVEKDLME